MSEYKKPCVIKALKLRGFLRLVENGIFRLHLLIVFNFLKKAIKKER